MRRLVRDQAEGRAAGDRFFTVEDLAGMLHAAANTRGLDVREFLVRVGADAIAVELNDLPRGGFEGRNAGISILMEDPGFERNAGGYAEVPRGELRDADVVQPRGDGHGLFPVRDPPAVSQIDLFLKQTIGHHLVPGGGGDQEFAGRLVVGMVDDGQPLARLVGPVGAEERALAEFVAGHMQPVRGNAAIAHGELPALPSLGRRWKRHHQTIGPMDIWHGRAARCHLRHGHALAVGRRRQIERELGYAVRDKAQIDGGLADNLVVVVVERDAKDVMLRVDARLPGIGVRENLWRAQDETGQ